MNGRFSMMPTWPPGTSMAPKPARRSTRTAMLDAAIERRRQARSAARSAPCGRTSGGRDGRRGSARWRRWNDPSANTGGGQSGSTISRMKVSRSVSYSAKSRTWPLCRSRSARSDSPWPRQSKRGDRKTPGAQVAYRLEVFFDPFAAALQDAHGAAPAGRRLPARIAQRHPVRRLQFAGDEIVRNGVGGDGNVMDHRRRCLATVLADYSRKRCAFEAVRLDSGLLAMPALRQRANDFRL